MSGRQQLLVLTHKAVNIKKEEGKRRTNKTPQFKILLELAISQ